MNWQRIVIPLAGLLVLYVAWHEWGVQGLAIALSGIVLWGLLHFTRMMHVLKQAANRPVGYVGSAVMLNARLKPKVNLLHVMAMTRSIGEALSPKDEQPEIFRWTDPGGSSVTCEFLHGRLVKWSLYRPPVPEDATAREDATSGANPAGH